MHYKKEVMAFYLLADSIKIAGKISKPNEARRIWSQLVGALAALNIRTK